MKPHRRRALLAIGGCVGLIASACGSTGNASNPGVGSSSLRAQTLMLGPAGSGPYTDDFNPFTNNGGTSAGVEIYEPLMMWQFAPYTHPAPGPWLANSYRWSANDKQLTLELRKDVKWSNGTPFTSADVVETFSIIKKNPGLNPNGITFQSVKAAGPHTVVFTFSSPSYAEFFYLVNQVIVPATVWRHVAKPTTYSNKHPVGTGPFMLQHFAPSVVTLVRNPHYWGGPPHVRRLQWITVSSDTAFATDIEAHAIDWGNGNFAGWKTNFVDKDPKLNHAWIVPVGIQPLIPNLQKYPLNLLAFRKAISMVLDRKAIARIGEYGYDLPATSPTDLFVGNELYMDPSLRSLHFTYNVKGARALLRQAGFHWNSQGALIDPKGQPVSLTITTSSAYGDRMTDGTIIASELKNGLGIKASQPGISNTTFSSDWAEGKFDLLNGWINQIAPDPYVLYNQIYNTKLMKPVGQDSSGDWERWTNPIGDRDLSRYLRATTSGQRRRALYALESLTAKEYPVIPYVLGSNGGLYSSKYFTGWPSAKDPYAFQSAFESQFLPVLLRLRPRS